eukprot:Amastigsp_a703_115.p2 type:complete len:313 gc:universal Amastigsp_a703_115:459-1397(+)
MQRVLREVVRASKAWLVAMRCEVGEATPALTRVRKIEAAAEHRAHAAVGVVAELKVVVKPKRAAQKRAVVEAAHDKVVAREHGALFLDLGAVFVERFLRRRREHVEHGLNLDGGETLGGARRVEMRDDGLEDRVAGEEMRHLDVGVCGLDRSALRDDRGRLARRLVVRIVCARVVAYVRCFGADVRRSVRGRRGARHFVANNRRALSHHAVLWTLEDLFEQRRAFCKLERGVHKRQRIRRRRVRVVGRVVQSVRRPIGRRVGRRGRGLLAGVQGHLLARLFACFLGCLLCGFLARLLVRLLAQLLARLLSVL